MPASGCDPVSATLRFAFSTPSKAPELDKDLEASAKRVLLSKIDYEPATNYQTNVLNTLKSKYIVINPSNILNCSPKIVKNLVSAKKNEAAILPLPKTILFPAERVQRGYRGNMLIGSGMLNMGNTCYLNSTLQALFHVPALVNWLLSETGHQKCEQTNSNNNNNNNTDYPPSNPSHSDDICCAVVKTLKCSQMKNSNVIKPICVYSKLKAICKHLTHGSQEDAHEFMRYLLESLEKNYLQKNQGNKLDSYSKETTPVNQIFGGYIRTEVVCLACKEVSTTFQHFQDLPLDIRKSSTLDDALAGYFERERLPDGEDAYKCEKCNRKVPATKKFTIEKPPNVLCVQLKRFSAMNGKITKQVQLPQYLDITRFISPSVQARHPVKYRLVSMITHMGPSANCGHYTAIALAANGYYYQFDDSSVRQISLNTVLNMSAYIVLFEMERAFTSPTVRPAATSTTTSTITSNSDTPPVRIPTPKQHMIPTPVKKALLQQSDESKREGKPTQPKLVMQIKQSKVHTPPTNHHLHQEPTNTAKEKSKQVENGKLGHKSLVPYDSDASLDSDTEKSKSELEKLLTEKKTSNLQVNITSNEKGWQVTSDPHLDSPIHSESSNVSACSTSSWNVTHVNTKLKRHSSEDLERKKCKLIKRCGSDSELRKSSCLEKYITNFSDCETKNEILRKIKSENSVESSRSSKKLDGNDERSVNGNDFKSFSNFNSAGRNGDVVKSLMQNSHKGYGSSNVKSWNGTDSCISKEVTEEKEESKKRSCDDMYNEDFDRGKVWKIKKMRFDYNRSRNNRPNYNLFQERANQQWRNGGHTYLKNHRFNRDDRFKFSKYNNNNNSNSWKYPNNKNKFRHGNSYRHYNRFNHRY